MQEICMLRSRWRGLETESRLGLHGHERGNPGYRQDPALRTTAPALDPTTPAKRFGFWPQPPKPHQRQVQPRGPADGRDAFRTGT